MVAWEPGIELQEGKYVIEKKLGEGGFGITYLARHETGNLAVIKTLNDKVRKRRDFAKCQQDFLNEALRLAKCTHRYIVQIDELIQEGPSWCMVMEYIEGIDLANLVENEGVLPESEALRYIQQIGEAVSAVHERGFLHRDIKPLNVLVRTDRSEAVLIDFGLAREFTQNLTQVHTELFSNGFAPIEQYDRRSLRGAYTDVYALAATLYAVLTGKAPESAPSRDRSLARYKTDPLVPPKQLNPQLSDRANEAILQGLALEPEDRPQSVGDWLQLLEINSADPIAPSVPESVSTASDSAPPERSWSSAVGMDYSQLRNLLAGGLWQEADRETASVMLQVCGREKQGKLSQEDIENFPCRDLRAIDNLWVQYSSGRFGFSVQIRIWENVAENYDEFGDRIGWRRDGSWLPYPDLSFNPTALEGHLPSWGRRGRLWSLLATRIKQCSL